MLISLGNSTCFQFKIHTFCSIFPYNLTLFQEALHLIDSKQDSENTLQFLSEIKLIIIITTKAHAISSNHRVIIC